jgi:hypothetical protein
MTTGPAFTVHSHQPSERERLRREASLDETIEQSFPASDPPSTDRIQTAIRTKTRGNRPQKIS